MKNNSMVMSLLEYTVNEYVHIDFEADYEFGSDQAFVSYPCRFATVTFRLNETELLCRIADRIRQDAGFKPLYAIDESTGEMREEAGWYEFNIGINDYTDSKLDTCITFALINGTTPDTEETYVIDLSPEEQKLIYERLNEECEEHLGRSCKDLLAEAGEQMMSGDDY